jgi:BirA family biotin operon repressor/biotin-[acetyl-CoA-carboxylase] ligase
MLRTSAFGRPYREHHQSIDSTNLRALELAADGLPQGSLVTADAQTGGRGRLNRVWHSPPGRNIYFSLILRPALEISRYPLITLAAGLGCAEGLAGAGAPVPDVKWPNDLLLGGRKIAGLLCETGPVSGRRTWVVLGVGINVNLREDELPPDVESRAGSLSMAAGRPFDRSFVLASVLSGLEKRYLELEAGRASVLLSDYRRRCHTLGRQAAVTGEAGRLEGRAEDIDEHGRLVVRTGDGRLVAVGAGEVTLSA